MKHTIKLLTLAAILTAVFGLTGCPGPVNNYIEPAHEHVFGDWGEWEVVTAATCTENGTKKRTRTCSCGEVEEETAVIAIAPNNHDFGEWSNWTTTIEVAYDHDGEKEHTHTCTRCGHSETVKVTIPRFVAGGYDGDIPTDVENPETYRYQYADEDDYQISAYVYSSVEDALADENKEVLYFSFPNDTTGISQIVIGNNGPKITIDNLVQMKNGYVGKTVKYFAPTQDTFIQVINNNRIYNTESSQYLTNLKKDSPVYIVLEPITNE